MKRFFRNGIVLMGVLALVGSYSAWAVCSGVPSEPVWFGAGGNISNCPDAAQVGGWIYLLSAPTTTNSGAQSNDVVCEQANVHTGANVDCQPEAGVPGDGVVTINYEFGEANPASVGCPTPGANGTDGSSPVAVQVVCNNGASVLLQTGWSSGLQMYLLEQSIDFSNTVAANFSSGPTIVSVSAGPSPSASNICVNVPIPHVFSDCDPTSQNGGNSPGSTCDTSQGARPAAARGKLYYIEANCTAGPPSTRLTDGWVLQPGQPDATGLACNPINTVSVSGNCGFLGVSGMIGATETAGILSWVRLGGPTATNDKVKIDKAEYSQGKLFVDFSTTNETSTVGFNVYSGSTKLNSSLIAAKGAGSNAYTFETGRGTTKGGKSVYVEAVKSDGTVEKSAPVALK
jgi:hypothetical protein